MVQCEDTLRRKIGDRAAYIERFLICLGSRQSKVGNLNARVWARRMKEDVLGLIGLC